MVTFGERLRMLRTEHNLTQKMLAVLFNVSQATVADWERGITETSFETLIALSRYFSVSTDYLLGIED